MWDKEYYSIASIKQIYRKFNQEPCSKLKGISMEKIVSLVTAIIARKCHCEEPFDIAQSLP